MRTIVLNPGERLTLADGTVIEAAIPAAAPNAPLTYLTQSSGGRGVLDELAGERSITKARAIELLGGTQQAAADAIGVTVQAIDNWPDVLPPRITDRVLAALARKFLSAEMLALAPANATGGAN